MNEVLNCLLTRRSVKKYLSQPVEKEKLDAVLEAGTYAACGMGRQAGKIVVLQNPDAHPFYGAPVVCVVFADTNVNTWVEDGSLVIGNMMAAAHSLGLGSCWIHRARQEFESAEGKALMKKWGVSENYAGIGHCILGYAAQEPAPAKPRKADFIVRVDSNR